MATLAKRFLCTKSSYSRLFTTLSVTKEYEKGFSVVEMSRAPTNSLNLGMFQELTQAIDELERDASVRGLILTSTCPKCFSLGIDLKELYKPDAKRMKQVAHALQDLWMKLYATPLATVAAINGNSPAAGCLIALCCDYRVMADGKFNIGLNETQLGIIPTQWVFDTATHALGSRQAEKLIQLGKLLTPQEALGVAMIDELVPEDKVRDIAVQRMQTLLSAPEIARQNVKKMIRHPVVEKMQGLREQNADNLVTQVCSEETQMRLKFLINRHKGQASSKSKETGVA